MENLYYPPAYTTYLPERGSYEAFAKSGCHLYSACVFFGNQTINAASGIAPFRPGIFSDKSKIDFSSADEDISHIVKTDPDAMIFPRVNVSPPLWWEDENPDELNDVGINGGRRRVCFAS